MAVNSNDQGNQGSNASSAGSANASSGKPTNQYEINRIASFFPRSISRQNTGEVLTKWHNAFKALAEKNGMTDVQILLLNKEVDAVALSAVIFAIPFEMETVGAGRSTSEVKIIAYSLILEGSAEPLQDRNEQVGNVTVPSKVVAADLYSKEFVNAVSARVAEKTGIPQANVVDATFSVIPADANPEDEETVNLYAFHLESAIVQIADTISGTVESRFNLAFLPKTTRVKADVAYNQGSAKTAAGLPVRSDISITTYAQDIVNGNASALIGGSVANKLAVINGYVDLIRTAQQQPVYGQAPSSVAFKPVFVATRIESLINGNSLELQLFALSSLAVINEGRAWAGQFKPTTRFNTAQGEADLKDIGAIGYRWNPNPGQAPQGRFDTKSNDFKDGDFIQLMSASTEAYPLYAIDVARGDELYWLNSAFIVASNPQNQGYTGAVKAIIDAANALTNNAFGKRWNPNELMFAYSGNQVHLGYYTTKDGVRHDLRDLDYVAMENLFGQTDPGTVLAWQQTFDNISEPLPIRLSRRYTILESVTGATARVKDFAVRVYATPKFIQTLIDACVEAGLHITPENVASFYGQSATFNPVAQGLSGGGFNGGLTQNTSNFNSNYNNAAPYNRF